MFILLALTDFVDGRVARARNLVTRKGKVFDIICDQVLLWSTVWLLIREDIISFSQSPVLFWALIVIMFREISVTAVRLFAKIKAGDVRVLILGKCKTGFFMVGLAALLTSAVWPVGSKLGVILLGIAALCSFFSGLQYIHQFVSKPSSSLR
jgi:CDP-diacylglycerol--glycerol-3-phosphate 3-phosphatidyltransferase